MLSNSPAKTLVSVWLQSSSVLSKSAKRGQRARNLQLQAKSGASQPVGGRQEGGQRPATRLGNSRSQRQAPTVISKPSPRNTHPSVVRASIDRCFQLAVDWVGIATVVRETPLPD
jgi:hypothetical protein